MDPDVNPITLSNSLSLPPPPSLLFFVLVYYGLLPNKSHFIAEVFVA